VPNSYLLRADHAISPHRTIRWAKSHQDRDQWGIYLADFIATKGSPRKRGRLRLRGGPRLGGGEEAGIGGLRHTIGSLRLDTYERHCDAAAISERCHPMDRLLCELWLPHMEYAYNWARRARHSLPHAETPMTRRKPEYRGHRTHPRRPTNSLPSLPGILVTTPCPPHIVSTRTATSIHFSHTIGSLPAGPSRSLAAAYRDLLFHARYLFSTGQISTRLWSPTTGPPHGTHHPLLH